MTRMELIEQLPQPWCDIMKIGSIDYKSKGRVNSFAKTRGYKIKMSADCTYYCENLPWFNFPGYGNWGTCFCNTTDNGIRLFVDMWKERLITLWRGRIYKDGCTYNYEDSNWTMYKDGHWIKCESPLKGISFQKGGE